ncbi:MAG: hypothetical protein V4731_06205 [Pseudomonadota bacterium]
MQADHARTCLTRPRLHQRKLSHPACDLYALLPCIKNAVGHILELNDSLLGELLSLSPEVGQPGDGVFGRWLIARAMRIETAGEGLVAMGSDGVVWLDLAFTHSLGLRYPSLDFRAAAVGLFCEIVEFKKSLVVALPWIRPAAINMRQAHRGQVDACSARDESLNRHVIAVVILHLGRGFHLHHVPGWWIHFSDSLCRQQGIGKRHSPTG